jgi:hypothetical protein
MIRILTIIDNQFLASSLNKTGGGITAEDSSPTRLQNMGSFIHNVLTPNIGGKLKWLEKFHMRRNRG